MDNTNTHQRKQSRLSSMQAAEINGMVPPQALELEKSVLGALMLNEEALYGSIDKIHEGLFYKAEHQVIFAAIRTLVNNSRDVDLLTVTEQLTREGKLELAGGAFYLSQLTNNVVSAAHLDYHITILTEKFIQREVIRTSTENIKEAYDVSCDALELIDRAQVKLMEVSELSFKKECVSVDNIMNDAKKVLFAEQPEEYGVLSGFVELDRLTSGFQPGTLIILAARPSMGKTACGLSMARNIAVDFHKPVAFFSLEMPAVELAMRLISSEAEISSHRLKNSSSLCDSEKNAVVQKMQELGKAPLYFDDTAGLDIFQLRAKCRKMKQKYGIKMVFIDYLQLMTSSGEANKNRNREQELSAISRQLKEMAKELEIPVLAMAQFNRKADDRPMGIPQLSDLRESGAIEQDADIVIAIHRLWKYGIETDEHNNSTENQATLRILKHRSGELGVVNLRFDGKYVRFSNPPLFTVESRMNSDIKPNGSFDSTTDDGGLTFC